jgi:DNA invertase Pin-like site-specific DNA recombinase
MTGKRIGYIRVSTLEQNPDRQLEGMPLDKKFTDYASGGHMARPQLDLMMQFVREDDLIFVHSMDRLARNIRHLRNLIDEIVSKSASVIFVKENLTFDRHKSPINDLMLMIMGSVAEFELARIHERQREGIKLAQRAGKYTGRKRALDDTKIELLKHKLATTRETKAKIARDLGIHRTTLYEYLKKIEQQQEKIA